MAFPSAKTNREGIIAVFHKMTTSQHSVKSDLNWKKHHFTHCHRTWWKQTKRLQKAPSPQRTSGCETSGFRRSRCSCCLRKLLRSDHWRIGWHTSAGSRFSQSGRQEDQYSGSNVLTALGKNKLRVLPNETKHTVNAWSEDWSVWMCREHKIRDSWGKTYCKERDLYVVLFFAY